MKRRQLGKKGPEVSALGFGCMRFPVKDGKIDRVLAKPMLLKSYKAGVDYWDTAWPYHDGDSEVFISEILRDEDGPNRDEIVIADKLPSWLIKEASDLDRFFDTQLERLGTDYIDVYLLHTLNKEHWATMKSVGALEWLEKKKASGQIKYAGFSFHDDYPVFEDIIESWDWDVCQIQYNFMDVDNQAGEKGLRLAHDKGIGIIVMEPLLGGKLVEAPPTIAEIWEKSAHQDWSPVERALRWIWNQGEVGTVLSGMSTMEHVVENLRIASDADAGDLAKTELGLYSDVRSAYDDLKAIGCTACNYCMPCPQGVNIPGNFGIYNIAAMFKSIDAARGQYDWQLKSFELGLSSGDQRALHCISCGECEPKCPQKLEIGRLMPEVAAVLGEGKDPAAATI